MLLGEVKRVIIFCGVTAVERFISFWGGREGGREGGRGEGGREGGGRGRGRGGRGKRQRGKINFS